MDAQNRLTSEQYLPALGTGCVPADGLPASRGKCSPPSVVSGEVARGIGIRTRPAMPRGRQLAGAALRAQLALATSGLPKGLPGFGRGAHADTSALGLYVSHSSL